MKIKEQVKLIFTLQELKELLIATAKNNAQESLNDGDWVTAGKLLSKCKDDIAVLSVEGKPNHLNEYEFSQEIMLLSEKYGEEKKDVLYFMEKANGSLLQLDVWY